MNQSKQFPQLSAIALAVLALSIHCQAAAQEASAAPSTPTAVQQEIQQVVVTGTASASGTRKIDAAFSITTATEEQLKMAAPSSTADIMKLVPGAYAEPTGGQSGANIQVRGFPSGSDSPFVSVQVNGNPIYPVPVLSFFEGSSSFRLDDTIERVEVLRGGPSTIYSVGQPGATMNFILKKGTDTPEGSLRFTAGTGNLRRVDGVYSGKIAEGWYGMIGGFYRVTDGVRKSGFPADDGGQLSASLTRKLDGGELTFYARGTNDKNAFYTGVPLISSNEGRTISAFPGFDPLTGTLMSNEMRNFTVEAAPGRTLNYDLGDGRGLKSTLLGMDFQQNLNGWQVSNKLNYFKGDLNTIAMFTGNNPLSAADYLRAAIASNNGNAATLAAAGGVRATTGVMTYVKGGAVSPNQQVVQAGLWAVEKKLQSFTDEFRVSRDIGAHTVTGGAYVANYSSKDVWFLGNSHLMSATPQASLINVRLDNGVVVANNGKDGNIFYAPVASYDGDNTALYLADEWRINDRIKLDAGVRREKQRLNASVSNLGSVDPDNNPLTVYNNGTSAPTGSFTSLEREDSVNSFTLGGLYKLTKDSSVFVRANQGHTFIYFDDMRNAGSQAVLDDRSRVPTPKVKQFEVGFKTATPLYSAYVNAFFTDFTGISFQQITTTGVLYSVSGSEGKGVEFELALRPITGLQLQLTGNWQDSEYKDNPSIAGNTVQRQPKFQYRFSPSYRLPLGEQAVRVYGTYSRIGSRWADQANQQFLPAYETLDLGVLAELSDKLELRVSATNVTNEVGLTEGNSRLTGGNASGPINARPLFGRAVEASLTYRF
ncbi:TonB-dependent receptor [Telluria aromaticivorans]|uniref:TonB-dependent receptor n=1 Tax=Telluria aromaticivorans TaxID=2725995 RepID=A0A7Y2NY39_9BURK|nr:TonB-dependent receptor [Telluria aromaticivorans]NNG21673.1 TonB-dependent receptor [Telluria aromaticivorans]